MSEAAVVAAETVEEGRELAEELMVDACSIAAPAGRGTFAAGTYTAPASTPVYAGPCQVQMTDSLNAQTPQVGERQITLLRTVVKVPLAATGIEVGHVLTITAVGAPSDVELVDKEFRVEATHAKTYATCRRLQCEEVAR